ncbi:MAG: hypothetical protein AAF108_11820, partial [Planctomycetota bacterium]
PPPPPHESNPAYNSLTLSTITIVGSPGRYEKPPTTLVEKLQKLANPIQITEVSQKLDPGLNIWTWFELTNLSDEDIVLSNIIIASDPLYDAESVNAAALPSVSIDKHESVVVLTGVPETDIDAPIAGFQTDWINDLPNTPSFNPNNVSPEIAIIKNKLTLNSSGGYLNLYEVLDNNDKVYVSQIGIETPDVQTLLSTVYNPGEEFATSVFLAGDVFDKDNTLSGTVASETGQFASYKSKNSNIIGSPGSYSPFSKALPFVFVADLNQDSVITIGDFSILDEYDSRRSPAAVPRRRGY